MAAGEGVDDVGAVFGETAADDDAVIAGVILAEPLFGASCSVASLEAMLLLTSFLAEYREMYVAHTKEVEGLRRRKEK